MVDNIVLSALRKWITAVLAEQWRLGINHGCIWKGCLFGISILQELSEACFLCCFVESLSPHCNAVYMWSGGRIHMIWMAASTVIVLLRATLTQMISHSSYESSQLLYLHYSPSLLRDRMHVCCSNTPASPLLKHLSRARPFLFSRSCLAGRAQET